MQEPRKDYFFHAVLVIILFAGVCYGMIKWSDVPRATSLASPSNAAPVSVQPQYNFYIGQRLYDSDGELFGRIVEISQSHVFENGAVEPGVLLTFRDRQGMEHTDLCWLPMRSAADMVAPNAR